jgi:hypothetical protein
MSFSLLSLQRLKMAGLTLGLPLFLRCATILLHCSSVGWLHPAAVCAEVTAALHLFWGECIGGV